MTFTFFLSKSGISPFSPSYITSEISEPVPLEMGSKDNNFNFTPNDKVFVDKCVALFLSIERNDIKGCEDALEGLRDINVQYYCNDHDKTIEGDTALHRAVKHNNIAIANLLVINGADIHKKNDDAITPVDIMGDQLLLLSRDRV